MTTARPQRTTAAAVINGLLAVVRAGGGMGLPPVSIPQATPRQRPQRSNKEQGTYAIDFGKAWIKSPSLTAGQCPVKEASDETYREW